jgi:hypothetical protein
MPIYLLIPKNHSSTPKMDIVQKEHDYGSLKYELSDSKLRSMLQILHSTLEKLVTKVSLFTQ